jgi:hypothetical protein
MVRNAGMTWTEILAPIPALPSPKYNMGKDIFRACKFCLTWTEVITDGEQGFPSWLLIRRRPLSEKQSKVLDRIVQRIEKFATASYSS